MKKNIVYILLILALIITTGVNVVDRMNVENAEIGRASCRERVYAPV